MTIITLPPDLESRLIDEASRRGTTAEQLALDELRRLFDPKPVEAAPGATLFDFLEGYIGVVNGTTEPLSENCGQRFADGLAEKQDWARHVTKFLQPSHRSVREADRPELGRSAKSFH